MRDPRLDQAVKAWYGASRHSLERLIHQFRTFIDNVLFDEMPDGSINEAVIVGFKEIRHVFLADGRFERYLAFLTTLFPQARLIFLGRAIDEVLSSGWWSRDDPRVIRQQIDRFTTLAAAYVAGYPDRAIMIHYDEIDRAGTAYRRIASFLDLDEDWPAYQAVLGRDHSYEIRNLSKLLRSSDPKVVLRDASWWRSNIDEFVINMEQAHGRLSIKGVLVVRGEVEDGGLAVDVSGRAVALPITRQTPEMARRFKFNKRAEHAGFDLAVPLPLGSMVTLRRTSDGAIVAELVPAPERRE